MVVTNDQKPNSLPLPTYLSLPRRNASPVRLLLYALGVFLLLWFLFLRSEKTPWRRATTKSDALWQWKEVEQIFAFGDSWTTTEFQPQDRQPRLENPMGNPDFPTDHSKRTPDWIEYMTGVYNQSFVRTYNLARGAATVDRDLVMPLFPSTWCFDEQVNDQYSQYYVEDETHASRRLFVVLFGLVDLALLTREGTVDDNVLHQIAMRYEGILHQLYDLGARHFLLFAIPPIDRAPDPEHAPELKTAIESFNKHIESIRDRVRVAHIDDPTFTIRVFNLHVLLEMLLDQPQLMEQTKDIKNVTKNCWEYNPDVFKDEKAQSWDYLDLEKCGIRRDQYFWANTLHVTHPVQDAIAAAAVEECFGVDTGFGLCK